VDVSQGDASQTRLRAATGQSAIWVENLATGTYSTWNEDARFPAASTVKLAVLIAALRKWGPEPERTTVAYDLKQLTGWSSNLAANRLLIRLAGSEAAGSALAQHVLVQLGATASTYTGDYRIGTVSRSKTAQVGAPDPPPLVSSRVTTARDLATILRALARSAFDARDALHQTGLSRHEARVGLAWLLASQPTGDNLGLFRPWLTHTPMAQKNGWLNAAHHTAAIIYAPTGPKLVVLLTYRSGKLTRPQAAALGRRVLEAAGLNP
jgi:Beta-lactamase enzyme family